MLILIGGSVNVDGVGPVKVLDVHETAGIFVQSPHLVQRQVRGCPIGLGDKFWVKCEGDVVKHDGINIGFHLKRKNVHGAKAA